MYNLKKKTNVVFYQICIIGILFLTMFIYLFIALYDNFLLIWSSILGRLEAACGCTSHFTFSNHPFLFISLIFASLAIITFLFFTIAKIISINKSTRNFIKNNLKNRKGIISNKLENVAKLLNLENKIVEINNSNLVIFCYGIFKPKICISSKFTKKLTKEELSTVLLHEQYHLMNFEPVKLLVIKAISKTLFFIPGLKALVKQYIILSELMADEWAVNKSRSKTTLASAIYKVLKINETIITRKSFAVPFFNNITDERIEKVVSNNYVFNFKAFSPKFVIIVFFFISSVLFFGLFLFSTESAIADHYDEDSCLMEHEGGEEQCDMTSKESECNIASDSLLEVHECTISTEENNFSCGY